MTVGAALNHRPHTALILFPLPVFNFSASRLAVGDRGGGAGEGAGGGRLGDTTVLSHSCAGAAEEDGAEERERPKAA